MKSVRMVCGARRAMSLAVLWLAAGVATGAESEVPFLTTSATADLATLSEINDGTPDPYRTRIDGPYAGTTRSNVALLRPEVGGAGASGYAGYGVLGASAYASVRSAPSSKAEPSGSGGYAAASVEFADELLISGPATLTGSRGTLIVPWVFSGSWGGGLTGPLPRNLEEASSGWNLRISTGTTWDLTGDYFEVFSEVIGSGEFYADKEFNETSSISEHRVAPGNLGFVTDSMSNTGIVPPIWAELSFVFGVPFTLGAQLSVEAQGFATNEGLDLDDPGYLQLRSADAFAQFGNTLRWGGIEQVLDANGNPVTDWTAVAASGVDYAVANTALVPEPATWLSMLLGLLTIALRPMQRRRRRGFDA